MFSLIITICLSSSACFDDETAYYDTLKDCNDEVGFLVKTGQVKEEMMLCVKKED